MRMSLTLRTIRNALLLEGVILFSWLYSFELFINLQLAVLSSFFIIIGSMYAYKRNIDSKVASEEYVEDRDGLDTIDDPHGLYEDQLNEEVIDYTTQEIKTIIQEEKRKIKTISLSSAKNAGSSFSLFRLIPYAFLVLSFIALQNNKLLVIGYFLPSLLVGIVAGYFAGKSLFARP